MREMKFRAFKRSKMYYNIGLHPYICIDHTKQDEEDLCFINPKKTSDGHLTLWNNDEAIMQYTGLKDKNSVEIYEGDIVRILYTDWPSNTDPNIPLEDYLISISHVGEVVYQAPSFGILMVKENRYSERSIGDFNYGPHGRIEVIGNIYQNPDLLP